MRRFTTLITVFALCLTIMAQGGSYKDETEARTAKKLTPQLILRLAHQKSQSQAAATRAKDKQVSEQLQTRIVVEVAPDGIAQTFKQMKAAGATICSRLGSQTVIDLPVDSLSSLERIDGVLRIDMGHKGRWKSDVSRVETGVSQLNGPTLPEGATSFTGKGVTVCLIDEGFDFQHPAFKDANGNSRIKCVYMLTDEGGRKFIVDDPEIGEYTFPGSVYDTPELIATLTTDDDEEYHGSHTAGIAAGSLSPQGFGGMAPEADLVLISLSGDFDEYEDVNDVIELAISFAVAYAQQNDQPVVLSCSANSHSGPHDGTSTVTKAIEEASQTLVPVFSAGNEGGYPVHLYQKFTETKKTIKTLLIGLMDSETDGYIYDMMASVAGYTRTGSEASIKLSLHSINQITGALKTLWSSDTFTATPDCEEAVTLVSSDDDATLAKYFKGELAVGAFDNGDGRLCIGAEVDGSVKGLYLFQLTIGGAPNTEIDLWDDVAGFGGTQLIGLPGYVDGDSEMSAGDWTSTERVISVGAYCANVNERSYDGSVIDTSIPEDEDDDAYVLDDIAWFSSYGTSFNDVVQPVICAPGVNIVSSFNQYYLSGEEVADEMQWQGYPYGAESGTSMSCPAVSGIIALWLEAQPTMTFDDVMDVLRNTSRTDTYTANDDKRWGFGKIDAATGISYINSTYVSIRDISRDASSDDALYDLQGRRIVTQPAAGIYIHQGRKVLVK